MNKYVMNVPYSEKDEAKKYGAKWDSTIKKWYYEAEQTRPEFDKWKIVDTVTLMSVKQEGNSLMAEIFKAKQKEYADIPYLKMTCNEFKQTIFIEDAAKNKLFLCYDDKGKIDKIMSSRSDGSWNNLTWQLDKPLHVFQRMSVSDWKLNYTFRPVQGMFDVIARVFTEYMNDKGINRHIQIETSQGWTNYPKMRLASGPAYPNPPDMEGHGRLEPVNLKKCYVKDYSERQVIRIMVEKGGEIDFFGTKINALDYLHSKKADMAKEIEYIDSVLDAFENMKAGKETQKTVVEKE